MNIFGGYENCVDILGHYKIGLVLGVISMHFSVFLRAIDPAPPLKNLASITS